jgi:hypothetical protein
MQEFRDHLKLNAEFGVTDLDKAVPRKQRGRPAARPVPLEYSLGLDEHPESCGCWMCEGYASYNAYVRAQTITTRTVDD